MPTQEIKCAVCHTTVMGTMELLEGEVYPGDEKCALVCDPCIALQSQESYVDFAQRQINIDRMNLYFNRIVEIGELTQNNFDLFLSDTAALVQQYLGGGGRLITWIETVSRNGFNATTTGFKTKTAYRGALINGLYPRAEDILVILNDL